MGIKNNYFYYFCSACHWVNRAIDKDAQWSYFLRMTLLGQAEMIEGIIPNMIIFNIMLVNFLFKKNWKMD